MTDPAPGPGPAVELLYRAIEAAQDVVFMTDARGVFTFVNPRFTQLYGFSDADVIGRATPRILKSGVQPAELYERLWRDLLAGRPVRSRHINRTRAGLLVTVEASIDVVLDAAGARFYVAVQRDVTAQIELQRESELAHRALEYAPDAVYWFDASGRILFANAEASRSTGYTRQELGALTIADLDAGDVAPSFSAAWDHLEREGVVEVRSRQRLKDGRLAPVEVRVSRFTLDGRPYGYAHVRDLTARAREQSRNRQAHAMEAVGRLASGIVHDFNNLLTAIGGYGELVLEHVADTPAASDMEEVLEATRRAKQLTTQLLGFARTSPPQAAGLNVNTAIEGVSKLLRHLLGDSVAIQMDLTPQVAPAFMDPGQFDQLVMNLVLNARDAMPQGGPVTLHTANVHLVAGDDRLSGHHAQGEYVVVSVSDAGVGIAPEHLPHVFEPFFTTKEVGKGTGLGLATVYAIVQAAGGIVDISSEIDRGTTVAVYLPRAREATPSAGPITATPPPSPKRAAMVLVVELDAGVRHFTRRILEREGHRVLVASTAAEAEQVADSTETAVEVLIMAVGVSGEGETGAADRLLRRHPQAQVVVLADHVSQVGADLSDRFHILHKPFSRAQLLRAIGTPTS